VVKVHRARKLQLLKVDSVVEGVHFVSCEKMTRVGWKAICRSVSDIAAMGGSPKHALVAVYASQRTSWAQLEALYRGIAAAAESFGISVVGGETGRIEGPLVCSVTLTGWVEEERLVLRSGGRVGDSVLVTGRLGGSLRNGHHLDFIPRLKEARWLTKNFKISAISWERILKMTRLFTKRKMKNLVWELGKQLRTNTLLFKLLVRLHLKRG
jgi:thiamine-monophosphate kinase